MEHYANQLLRELQARVPDAKALSAKHRGKIATLGFDEAGTWVPPFRLAGGSASFNVMDLWVRHGRGWAYAGVRGTPAIVADALAGELMPFWVFELTGVTAPGGPRSAEDWNGTSETGD